MKCKYFVVEYLVMPPAYHTIHIAFAHKLYVFERNALRREQICIALEVTALYRHGAAVLCFQSLYNISTHIWWAARGELSK